MAAIASLLVALGTLPAWADGDAEMIGLAVGARAPEFSLTDQSGRTRSLQELLGPHTTVLLFYRSGDW